MGIDCTRQEGRQVMVKGWVRQEVMVVWTREVAVEVAIWAGSRYIRGMIKYGLH